MNSVLILIFKNVIRFKVLYIFWCLIFVGICVVYFSITKNESDALPYKSSHTLCVVVPFRDRFDELLEFVPHMSKFLTRQEIRYYISIINQNDNYRFNRGSLINAGFLISTKKHADCDYVAMHDVDLLPLNDQISYEYPGKAAFHVASPDLHPLYHYKMFIGGIVLISNSQFISVNGLSNKFWGWGKEDDELYLRLKEKSIEIKRPGRLSTNKETTFRHIHGRHRKRDVKRCTNQTLSFRRDRVTGLHNLDYKLSSFHSMTIDGFRFNLYNVNLTCDREFTPWCVCP